MVVFKTRGLSALAVLTGLVLAGCQGSSGGFGSMFESSSPPPPPAVRPSIAPSDIIGRWGYSAYHREQDRARTETAAQAQCRQPYVISGGQAGGVMMLGHDSPSVTENLIKASTDGKTYVGPGEQPGGTDDREVVSFDGRVLVLKWVDPEVAGRYGTMVLVRCGAPGTPTSRVAAPRRAPPPR
jgi:hypothetical protein